MPRTRQNEVRIRMNDTEFKEYQRRLDKSSLSGNEYGLRQLLGKPLVVIDGWADITRQLKGISTNINQIAKCVNAGSRADGYVDKFREGVDVIWQLSRRLGVLPLGKVSEKQSATQLMAQNESPNPARNT